MDSFPFPAAADLFLADDEVVVDDGADSSIILVTRSTSLSHVPGGRARLVVSVVSSTVPLALLGLPLLLLAPRFLLLEAGAGESVAKASEALRLPPPDLRVLPPRLVFGEGGSGVPPIFLR